MMYSRVIGIVSLGGLFGLGGEEPGTPAPPGRDAPDGALLEGFGRLPLTFEANQGQTDAAVGFLARGPGYTLFLTSGEIVLALARSDEPQPGPGVETAAESAPNERVRSSVLRMHLIGGRAEAPIHGSAEQPGKVNYFLGNDPGKWLRNVPTYARVEYDDVYAGVDLLLYGNQGQLEYDFVVAPGADASAIVLGFDGVQGMEIDPSGDLVLHAPGGDVRQVRPYVYQEIDGARHALDGAYELRGTDAVGFTIGGEVDEGRPLIIDPVLLYSTYLGGLASERGYGIDVDPAGCAYVTGMTRSSDFPTSNAFQPTGGGSSDAFVAKLDPTGTALVYSTFLGGSGDENFLQGDVAVDADGNAYVTGSTSSTDFPTTAGAFQTVRGSFSSDDAFVTKLDPAGAALIYSTYLGGTSSEQGLEIELGPSGNAFVAGRTLSGNFPVAHAFQPTSGGLEDAFVSQLDAAGAHLVYSTYLGGASFDRGLGLQVDGAGEACVVGLTGSDDFPTTQGAFQPIYAGQSDAFVTRLNAAGSALVYSTFLGGTLEDSALDVTADASGNAYVTGFTLSDDFPTENAFQPTHAGERDVFLTKLDAAGSALVYSTYLGGSGGISSDGYTCFGQDVGCGVAVDASNYVYLMGFTSSCDFPVVGSIQPKNGNDSDAFVARFDPSASELVYSTFLGGSEREHEIFVHESLVSGKIALDQDGNAYVIGYTESTDFPTVNAFQPSTASNAGDAFVAKIGSAVFTVTNTNDDGEGSFRQALLDANAHPGYDSIRFDIPGSGVHSIAPLSALPDVSDPVLIDGFSQPGSSPNTHPFGQGSDAVLRIELNGELTGLFTDGLVITGGATTVRGLVINRIGGRPIVLDSEDNVIEGNYIGVNAGGTTGSSNAFGVEVVASNNRIGGLDPASRNVISFNNGSGIRVSAGSEGNHILGNFIGTNAQGTSARGNQFDGIELTGSDNEVRRNLISGNGRFAGAGIELLGSGNVIQENLIGTNVTGQLPIGNNQAGIYIQGTATENMIGGLLPGLGNVIAFNHDVFDQIGAGVAWGSPVLPTTNTLAGNSIHSNEALGIDFKPVGVNPNDAGDADSGHNLGQNHPVLWSAETGNGAIKVVGQLDGSPYTTYRIELFSNPACDPSGYGEGKLFLGASYVSTDSRGRADIHVNLALPGARRLVLGPWITATATDHLGNTSEFSPCVLWVARMPAGLK